MSNLYTGILIGAAVSGQFTSTTKLVNSQLKMIGETAGKLSNQKIKLDSLGRAEADLEKARARAAAAAAAVNDLRRELNAGPPRKDWARDFEAAKAASERAAAGVERARTQLTKADAAFRAAGGGAGGYAANMQKVGAEIDRVQAKQERLNRYMQAKGELGEWAASARTSFIGVGLAAAAAGRATIVPAVEFENAMLGVAKQVDGARDSSGKLTQTYYDMRHQIQMLGREMPMATNDIADMVTAGARMGIAKDELIGFTKTAGMMAEAFEMPAGVLADNMGKIAGIFKIPIPAIGDLADTINYLDDNAISKGADIIKVMQGDLAGAASTMGLSAKNAAALASTFLTLGESAERADTAASGMLRELANAKMNPKRYQIGLQMIGMKGDELQKGMITDAQGTILKVLDKIRGLPKEKQMEAVTRLFGKDWGGAIAKLAGGVGEYRRQLELANGEAAKGSMSREFQARLQTTSGQWGIFKNRIGELAVNIGSVLLPTVNNLLITIGNFAGPMADFVSNNKEIVKGLIGAATGFAAWKTVGAPIIGLLGNIKNAWTVLSMAFAANPVGLVLMGIAIAAGAIIANWDVIGPKVSATFDYIGKKATEAWQGVVSMWGKAGAFFSGLWDGIASGATAAWNGAGAWFSGAWQTVVSGATAAWDVIAECWNAAGNFFTGMWQTIQTAFQGGIVGIGTLLVNWSPVGMIYGVFASALSSLGISVPAKFSEFGGMIIRGLIGGIANMGGAIKDAIGGVADSTIGWFKDKLGIKSPSRVFIGLGQMVGEGAAQGIGSMGSVVGRATAGLGLAASMAFNPALAAPTIPAMPGLEIAAPTIPAPAPRAGGRGQAVQDAAVASPAAGNSVTQSITIQITQRPGEDAEALARRVADMLKRESQGARRGALGDWA